MAMEIKYGSKSFREIMPLIKTSKLKKFISFYKPYRLFFAAVLICAALSALAALAIPLCIRYITQEVLSFRGYAEPAENAAALILQCFAVMFCLILIQTLSGVFYDHKGHAVGAMIERDMRNELFSHCQRLRVSFFDKEKTGSLMSRITNDLLNMAEFCHHGPENLFIFIASFAGAFIILFRIDVHLTLAVFALLPLMVFYTIFFQGRLRKAYRENRERIADLNGDLEDTLAGIRVVKSFYNEKTEDKKFAKANEHFCRGRINIYKNEAYYYSVMEFFLTPLITACVVAAGALLISRSVISAPDLIVFLLYIGYLASPLSKIAQWVGLFQDAMAGFDRFMQLMDIKTEDILHEQDDNEGKAAARLRGHVEFINVSFSYGEELENVFENISLDIPAGTSLALIGSSGAGKTTLCSLIPRFYEISAGKILIDGRDIGEMDLGTLRRNIGVVAQDVYLFNGTVIENIAYGRPGADREDIIHAAKMAKAHDFIMALPEAYETEIGQRGIRLSGGQRQRLAIARAFLKDPPILILDEATSALDDENEKAVHESLDNFMKDRTVLIIAHRLSTIKKAGRVYSLNDGKLEESR